MWKEITKWKLNIIRDPGLDPESEKMIAVRIIIGTIGEIWIKINI